MKAVQIKKDVYWVGGIDWSLRNFHGYVTQRGSTYNAYLIIDEKITLIDTVKHYLFDELISRVSSIIDPSKIDYVVSLHAEMDHSGSLDKILGCAPNATVITCAAGKKDLQAQFNQDWNFQLVKTGDTVSLGKHSLQFLTTPMVHWPDNMVAYCAENKTLFSNDAFGQHLASHQRCDDEFPLDIIIEEAQKYYANIVMPYSQQTAAALAETEALDIDMIAPGHGIIWRSNIDKILAKYRYWSENTTRKKALIIYDSMWGTTEKIANIAKEVFEEKDYEVAIYDLKLNDNSDIMTQVVDAEYICVGSPTLNKGILPSVASFLTYLQGLAPKGRKGILFGSYGWAPQNMKVMQTYFESTGIEVKATVNTLFIPNEERLKEIKNQFFVAI